MIVAGSRRDVAAGRNPCDDAPVTDASGWTTRFDDATSRLLLERAGTVSGRLEILVTPPHDFVFFHPRVEDGVDPLAAATVLVRDGLRRAGTADVKLILEQRFPHADSFVAAAPAWGFAFDVEKVLVRAPVAALRFDGIEPPAGAQFVKADPELADVLGRVLARSVTASDRATSPRAFLAQLEAHCRVVDVFGPEGWVVLRIDGRAAGLVLPAFADVNHQPATNLYVGVVPEFARRGLGAVLVRRGIETMIARGATRYIGSCDVRNAPMLRVFEKIGCVPVTSQSVFVRPAAGMPR